MSIISKNYQAVALSSASPLEQIAYLFEKAAKHISLAKDAILCKDYESRFLESTKAADIMHGLSGIVKNNTDETREFIAHMSEFFDKTTYAMYDVNFQNDPAICDVLIRILNDMASTWRNASKEYDCANRAKPFAGPYAFEGVSC